MVPDTTIAARIHRTGGPEVFVLEEVPLPPLEPHQVRIAVRAAGVSYPDLLVRSGALPAPSLPHILGFEVAGAIEAIGDAVRGLPIGARVVAELPTGGGYAARAQVDAGALTRLPDALAFEDAVALAITGRTALLLLRNARVASGDTVFVPGALGGVGSFAVRLARRLGARVIAGVGSDDKHARARALGADAVVTYTGGAWSEEVRRHTDGAGADVVLQATGGAIGGESLRALAPRGRLVMFGADNLIAAEPVSADQIRALLAQGQSLGGFTYLRVPEAERRAAFGELAEIVASGALPVSIERFRISEVATAHARVQERRTEGKVVLVADA
ncbi:MAG: quinone oxidoreductase family protein [Kofleriaceae bacterium]